MSRILQNSRYKSIENG